MTSHCIGHCYEPTALQMNQDQTYRADHLRKAKPNQALRRWDLALGWPPSIKSLVNPRVQSR